MPIIKKTTIKTILYTKSEMLNALGIKGNLKRFYHSILDDTFEFEMEDDADVKAKEIIL